MFTVPWRAKFPEKGARILKTVEVLTASDRVRDNRLSCSGADPERSAGPHPRPTGTLVGRGWHLKSAFRPHGKRVRKERAAQRRTDGCAGAVGDTDFDCDCDFDRMRLGHIWRRSDQGGAAGHPAHAGCYGLPDATVCRMLPSLLYSCSASQRSASIAAWQPIPAAVMAWRKMWSAQSPAT